MADAPSQDAALSPAEERGRFELDDSQRETLRFWIELAASAPGALALAILFWGLDFWFGHGVFLWLLVAAAVIGSPVLWLLNRRRRRR